MEKIPDGLSGLFDSPEQFLLLLDFDGTLVDIVPDPRIVTVPDSLRHDLSALYENSALDFVIVTGRPVSSIDGFMGGHKLPVLGGHGVEFRIDPSRETTFNAAVLPEELRRLLCEKGQQFGCYVEDKMYSLSLHANNPAVYAEIENALADILCKNDLTCRMRRIGRTFEILQQNVNKGSGVAQLRELEKFRGKKIIYIGDDVKSDESLSIIAAKGGRLIAVGREQALASNAYFENPAAVQRFISTLAAHITGCAKPMVKRI